MAETFVTFETTIPDGVYLTLRAQGVFREDLAKRTQHLLAMRFFQERLLSLGQAAHFAGMNRWQFIDLLGENEIPVIDLNEEELKDEFAAVEQLTQQLRHTSNQ